MLCLLMNNVLPVNNKIAVSMKILSIMNKHLNLLIVINVEHVQFSLFTLSRSKIMPYLDMSLFYLFQNNCYLRLN